MRSRRSSLRICSFRAVCPTGSASPPDQPAIELHDVRVEDISICGEAPPPCFEDGLDFDSPDSAPDGDRPRF
jgi:hypothetical protein